MSLDQFFQSPWFTLISVIAYVLVSWWYLKHAYKAATDPAQRSPQALFKTFILGRPLIYVVLGGIVILPLILYSYYVLSRV